MKIIIPKGADTNLDYELVELTEYLVNKLKLDTGYGLGGEFGYGVDFENDTFMMHPYCWCEKDNCKWCNGNKPNFLYKPTDSKVWWYKWIGRGMDFNKNKLPNNWLEKCKDSVETT